MLSIRFGNILSFLYDRRHSFSVFVISITYRKPRPNNNAPSDQNYTRRRSDFIELILNNIYNIKVLKYFANFDY